MTAAEPHEPDITGLLVKWRAGDRNALDAVIPLVYHELHRVARARLRRERNEVALQTTLLVHETYIRLVSLQRLAVENRIHFFAVAARLMRQVLVDHARSEHAQKRGGGMARLALDALGPTVLAATIDTLELDRALHELAAQEERLCRVVELKFFAGLTNDEAAEALDVSRATVERDWAFAKAWLYKRLTTGQP